MADGRKSLAQSPLLALLADLRGGCYDAAAPQPEPRSGALQSGTLAGPHAAANRMKEQFMSDSSSKPRSGGKPLVLVGLVVVVVALVVGAYFLFFADSGSAPEGAQVSEGTSLVEGGAPSDLTAYLERTWVPTLPPGTTYRIEGNKLLDLAGEKDGAKFQIQEIEFLALDTENEPPHFADIRVKGLDVAMPPGQGTLGVERMQGDAVYAYQYDADAKHLAVPAVVFDLQGVGKLEFNGAFSDVTLDPASGPEGALNGIGGGKIDKAGLVFTDRGVIKWALEQQAKEQGLEVDALRTQAKLMLVAMGSQFDGKIEKQAIEAASTVLDKTENATIAITASPSEPFAFSKFMALGMGGGGMPDFSALEPLNLKIEAY